MAGISEMTENFDQQRFIVQSLVQKQFDGILEKGIKDDEILERTKSFAKTQLEKKVEEIGNKHKSLKSELDVHKETTSKKIGGLEQKANEQTQKLAQKEQENKALKDALQTKHIEEKIADWKRPAYWLLVLIVFILSFYFFQLFYSDWEYNYAQQLVNYIDNNPSETKREWMKAINSGLAIGVFTLIYFCWCKLFSKNKREEEIQSIIKKMPKEFKYTEQEDLQSATSKNDNK